MPRKKKLFVLDTNVILHDSSCLHQFEQHDIVIPITIMEELDQFKKGQEVYLSFCKMDGSLPVGVGWG